MTTPRAAPHDDPKSAGARYTVAASGVRGVLAYARARGVSTEDVLGRAGLEGVDLADPEVRIPQAASDAVFTTLAERAADPDFGLHFAERLDLDAFDVVGHLAVKSATLGEALRRVCAYSRILHDSGRVEMERRGRQVFLYPGCRGLVHDYARPVAEFASLSAVLLARLVTAVHVVPQEAHFKHPKPERVGEHVRLFGVVPVFGSAETTLVFDAAILDLPTRGAEPGVVTYLEAYARSILARLPKDDATTAARVEREIAIAMERGLPDIESVAARLGTTARTLQRRLDKEGKTFQEMIDVARRAFAERYLADERLSLAEVAFLLGFSDPSNFHRAFRRWTGVTPGAYRAELRGAPAASVTPV